MAKAKKPSKEKRPATVISIKEHERIVSEMRSSLENAAAEIHVCNTQERQLCELVNALFGVECTTIKAACKQVKLSVKNLQNLVDKLQTQANNQIERIDQMRVERSEILETAAREMEVVQMAIAAFSNAKERLRANRNHEDVW